MSFDLLSHPFFFLSSNKSILQLIHLSIQRSFPILHKFSYILLYFDHMEDIMETESVLKTHLKSLQIQTK
jgi:hypothetical protein